MAKRPMKMGKMCIRDRCDISYDLEYGYVDKLRSVLADLSAYDTSQYVEDLVDPGMNVLPGTRNGGCIAINRKMLEDKGLPVPTSYQDLLKPEYKGLISMPNPKSSGTGYMFLKSLVNAWGAEEAFDYFKALPPNVLAYTSSGSGPVNALVQGCLLYTSWVAPGELGNYAVCPADQDIVLQLQKG